MGADRQTLAQIVMLAALIAATAEYSIMIQRRELWRIEAVQRDEVHDAGLRNLVRVLLTDD